MASSLLPIIMGEAPGRNTDPDRPLSGSAGKRLALMAGLKHYDELTEHFELRNLIYEYPGPSSDGVGAAFPSGDAREAQRLAWGDLRARVVVLLGTRLARLYRVPEPYRWCIIRRREVILTAIPHPSGLNRLYNSHEERERAAETLRQAVDLNLNYERA